MNQANFSKQTIQEVIDLITSNKETLVKITSMENEAQQCVGLRSMLVEKLAINEVDAQEIIEDLAKGISKFDENFGKISKVENIDATDVLQNITKDMSDDETISVYSNLLTSLQLSFAPEKEYTEEEISTLVEQNKQKDLSCIIDEINSLLKNAPIPVNLAEEIAKNGGANAIKDVAEKINQSKNGYRLTAAVLLYVAQKKGLIDLSFDDDTNPTRLIGCITAAAVESILVSEQLSSGIIDLKTWQKVTEWILVALIFASLIVKIALVAGVMTGALFLTFASLIGTTILGLVVAALISVSITLLVFKDIDVLAGKVLDAFTGFYEKNIGPFCDRISSLWNKIKALREKESAEGVVDNEGVQQNDNQASPNNGNQTATQEGKQGSESVADTDTNKNDMPQVN